MPEIFSEHWERAQAILAYEIYGISLSMMAIAACVLFVLIFMTSGPRDRGLIGRLFDLVLVVLSMALLFACILGGFYIGADYDLSAWGAFAGVMLFAGIFFVYSSIRTARKNAQDRAKLADFLKRKNRG